MALCRKSHGTARARALRVRERERPLSLMRARRVADRTSYRLGSGRAGFPFRRRALAARNPRVDPAGPLPPICLLAGALVPRRPPPLLGGARGRLRLRCGLPSQSVELRLARRELVGARAQRGPELAAWVLWAARWSRTVDAVRRPSSSSNTRSLPKSFGDFAGASADRIIVRCGRRIKRSMRVSAVSQSRVGRTLKTPLTG